MILVSKDIWKIKPSSSKQSHYTIEKVLDKCSCTLKCGKCDACVHLYSCTCMDFLIHSTVCKHIHLVKILSESSRNDSSHAAHVKDPQQDWFQQDVSEVETLIQQDDFSLQGNSYLIQQDELSLQSVFQQEILIQQNDLSFQDASRQERLVQQDDLSFQSVSQEDALWQQETLIQPPNDSSLQYIVQKETLIQQGEDAKSFSDATDNDLSTLNLSSLEYLSSHMNQSHSDIVSAKNKAKTICKKLKLQ